MQVEEGSGDHSDSEVVYPVMETSGGTSGNFYALN